MTRRRPEFEPGTPAPKQPNLNKLSDAGGFKFSGTRQSQKSISRDVSVLYLVDAYNLLFRSGKKKGSLEKERQSLIQQLNEIISRLHIHVTLVFDGAGERIALPTRAHFDAIEIIYTTKGQTADEYISDEVFHAKKPSQLTIVTNDRELAARCKNFRAKILTLDDFLQLLLRKKKTKKTSPAQRAFRDSDREIERLLKIFEKKLLDKQDIN